MMKRWWHYLIAGILAWLFFLVWRLPAAVAYDMAADSLGGKAQAVGIEGTLWHGTARQLQYQGRALGAVDWQLSPWGLLLGRLGGALRLTQGDAYLQVDGGLPLTGGEVTLASVEGRLPFATLQPHLTMLPIPLDGVVSLKLEDIEFDAAGRPLQASGRIVWSQAGVLAPQRLQFGDLQLTLSNVEGGGIAGELKDGGGPLQLQATLSLGADGAYRLEGRVKAAETAPAELRNSLGMLGSADSQGYHPINLSGTL